MIDVNAVKNWPFEETKQSYSEKDAMLYALALGYGSEPCNDAELRFVFEKSLVAVPSLVTTLCYPGFWLSDPKTGIDATKVVNGEFKLTCHQPLKPSGTLRGITKVVDIIDKGEGKGALIVSERKMYDDKTGVLIATVEQLTMCRGDGGFSGQEIKKSTLAKPVLPDTAPDYRVDIQTLPQSALIYRLCADMNPLHADPAVAKKAGFDRPILHGLCTYGVAVRAVVEVCGDNDPAQLAMLSGRFSAPVFPGEIIRTEVWETAGLLQFRCLVPERNVVVISNGEAVIKGN